MKKIDFAAIKKLNKSQKILIGAFSVVIFLDIVLIITSLATKNRSSLKLKSVSNASVHSLIALDEAGRKAHIKEKDYANFGFTENQKSTFIQTYNEYGAVALTLRIDVCPTEKQKSLITTNDFLKIGYLYEKDFTAKNKFIKHKYPVNNRIEIQAKEDLFTGLIDISFALPKNADISQSIPKGFYVYSDEKCKIVDACITPAYIGFDNSLDVPFYGFAYNGGKIDFSNKHFDFSGGQMVFPTENTDKAQLPQIVVQFASDRSFNSESTKSENVEINIGGEKFFINSVKSASKIVIPCGALKKPFGRIEIIKNDQLISSVRMESVKKVDTGSEILTPIKTDPGLILNYRQNAWRTIDYELYQWDRFPGILFFDTRDYKIQENFFSRLAYFVEKEGYKGRLLTNEELEGKHGYNAHDYSAESMAKFFNKATELDFKLNKEELLLKEILLKNGLFEQDGNLVKANDGGIVSISRECPDWSRINLLAHEGWHTIFFRDEEFRNYVSAVYYTFDSKSLEFLIDFFKSQPGLGYDVNDTYLMHNEFMAYIMQQRVSQVAEYFVHCANRGSVRKFTPELAAYVRDTKGIGFEDAAIALNDFVFDKYGIVCGNIALVNR